MARKTDRTIDNIVVQRIVDQIKKRGKREVDLTNYLGLSPNAMTQWKYGGSYVYTKYIYEICEYLDTTPNYLFFGPEDEEERLSPEEMKLIRIYRSLDEERKKCVRDVVGYIKDSKGRKRKKYVVEEEFVEKPLL